MSQTQHLACHFRDSLVQFTQVFSSDLDRATDTARAICQKQLGAGAAKLVPIQASELQEQQLVTTSSSLTVSGHEFESEDEMKARSRRFLRVHILPLLYRNSTGNKPVIAIVAHSVILQILWICLAELFDPGDIHFGQGLSQADFEDGVAPLWSNTGVMELDIEPRPRSLSVRRPRDPAAACSPLSGWSMTILAVDSVVHLLAGTGHDQVGSTGKAVQIGLYDSSQQTMDEFYRIIGPA